ncbi:serine hydrolase domain-containing protein, partial [Streptomyces sp. NPDC057854]|uniref:serine hydrolase domain-containing protein n=1 Tax=Streptomyces sp. NPDC057854 TaxID=3346264 RepID=UPI003695DF65
SNTDYILLGMLIEKTTGRSWQQEVDRRIIRPLGLSETTMPENDPAVPGRHTRAYVSLPGGPVDVTLFSPTRTPSRPRPPPRPPRPPRLPPRPPGRTRTRSRSPSRPSPPLPPVLPLPPTRRGSSRSCRGSRRSRTRS